MSNRVHANARIPEETYELHVKHVQEKHAAERLYNGVEAELAIREYLDQDGGDALEERLRERCTSVGCSPPKRKKLVSDTDTSKIKKAQWRIRLALKDDLKQYATENDITYSKAFALAIREYWTNSRLDRLESLYDRLDTAIEPWNDQIGSDGVNASVKDKRATAIAMELGESFTRAELEDAIAEVTSDSDYNRREYTSLVAEYKGVEEHPNNPDLFIPNENAAQLCENADGDDGSQLFEQSFDDLTASERVLRIRARLYRNAASSGGKAAMIHSEVAAEFDDEPGKTTVYNLMESATEADGFKTTSPHGTKRLQITNRNVNDTDVIEAASLDDGAPSARSSEDTPEDARPRLDDITSVESIQHHSSE